MQDFPPVLSGTASNVKLLNTHMRNLPKAGAFIREAKKT